MKNILLSLLALMLLAQPVAAAPYNGSSTFNYGSYPAAGAGTGSVTSVSVVTAHGISGTVASPTSTPAITLTLGAITPTTVNGNTFTTGTYTLTGTAGKTLTFDKSLEFDGTDSTKFTFPSTSGTVETLGLAQTVSGVKTHTAAIIVSPSVPAISTATFAINAALSNTFRVVLVHSACPCTISNPTNAVDGEKITIEMVQSSTGSDTIGTWGNAFDFGTAGSPTLSTGANKEDFMGFQYSSQNSKWNYLGIQQGM